MTRLSLHSNIATFVRTMRRRN